MYKFIPVIGFLVVLAGCSADFVPFSGGELSGSVTGVPADWRSVSDVEVIQLETDPGEPYSVKLWVIAMDQALYVHAGANRAAWVENIESDPAVRLQAADAVYELTAARVSDQSEFDAFSEVYEKKYGNPPRNGDVNEAYLYRLTPRG